MLDNAHSCRVHNTGNEARSQLADPSFVPYSKISYENLLLPKFACGG